MGLEAILVVCVALVAAAWIGWRGSRTAQGLSLLSVAAIAAGALAFPPEIDTNLRDALPTDRTTEADAEYASSDACRSCHPAAYQAWENSYHRTMTQKATPATVLADFEQVTLSSRGHTVKLERRGETFWAELPDPLWFQDQSPDKISVPPRIEARVVMTTGSHHLQNYWIRRPNDGSTYLESRDNGALIQIPFVWLVDAERWVPGQDSFLTPYSDVPESNLVWNTSCHVCHSVATAPGYGDNQFKTASVELGVACEACHGPAAEHIAEFQNPLTRYTAHWTKGGATDLKIENPERMERDRSVEACGQCHSFSRVVDIPKWKRTGIGYQPGTPLSKSKALLRYSASPSDPHLLAQLADEPNALVGRFWNDGTIRVTGREMNAVVESACFAEGELTCLSCHSMHEYASPDDQLRASIDNDTSCLSCHAELGSDIPAHTRHPIASEGSRCMNCHMPHTTYGLFSAIRSHRIDSPSAAVSAQTGRPNACNLCHLDKSLGWADRELQSGWDIPPAGLPDSEREIAASVEWALAGDAAQRAILAWHFGWKPAAEASGDDWQPLFLGHLLSDAYVAVRRVAETSIRQYPGFAGFDYDYLAPAKAQQAKSQEAWRRWSATTDAETYQDRAELLLTPTGEIESAPYEQLLHARDRTPLRIIE